MCDEEAERWVLTGRASVGIIAGGKPVAREAGARPEIVAEKRGQSSGGAELVRVYFVKSAALLTEGQDALIGVLTRESSTSGRVLFAVGQFDMPNYGGHHTLETERGRERLAAQQLTRLQELAASLASQ